MEKTFFFRPQAITTAVLIFVLTFFHSYARQCEGSHVSTTTGTIGIIGPTLSIPHTVSGTDQLLVVTVSTVNAFPSSVTYAGLSLTLLESHSSSSFRASIWYLTGPPAGTANAVITVPNGSAPVAGVSTFSDVDLSNPFGEVKEQSLNGSNPALTLSGNVDGLFLDVVSSSIALAPGSGQTQLYNTQQFVQWGASSFRDGAPSASMSWTSGGFPAGAYIAAAINPCPFVPPVQPPARTFSLGDTMVVFDRFGNRKRLKDIAISQNSEAAGIFRLHFADVDSSSGVGFDDAVQGPARRAVLVRMFEDLTVLLGGFGGTPYPLSAINCPPPFTGNFPDCRFVEIEIKKSFPADPNFPMPTQVDALASQWYLEHSGSGNILSSGIVHGEVWKRVNTGWDPYIMLADPGFPAVAYFHGYMQFNFDTAQTNLRKWFTDLADTSLIASDEKDLYSVALHEAFHILGIASAMDANGGSIYNIAGTTPYGYYDVFLTANNGSPLISWPSNCYASSFAGTAADLISGCTSPAFFRGPNTTPLNLQVYTPSVFADGSSLSHFNCLESGVCPPGYITDGLAVNHCADTGPAWIQRFPGQAEVFALCDLGYNNTGTYGTDSLLPSFQTYLPCTAAPDPVVAGVNDFQQYTADNSGAFFMMFNKDTMQFVDVTANGPNALLQNDRNAVGMGCVSVIGGAGSLLDVTFPDAVTSFRFVPAPFFCGTAVIRYRPVNAAGTKGNITYVFVEVTPPPLPPCSATGVCGDNILCFGGFEELECFDAAPFNDFRITSINSADLHLGNVNLTNNSTFAPGICPGGTVTNPFPIQEDKYIGIVGDKSINMPDANIEAFSLPLNAPLTSGTSYNISFFAQLTQTSCSGDIEIFVSDNMPCPLPGDWLSCGTFSPFPVEADTAVTLDSAGWKQYAIPFTVPAGRQFNFITFVAGRTNGLNNTNVVFFDSIRVTEFCPLCPAQAGFTPIGSGAPGGPATAKQLAASLGANVTPADFTVEGTFTVDTGFTFTADSIRLAPEARIHITAPNTLTLTNAAELFACTDLWDGIYIDSGATLVMNGFAKAEDARNAVVSVGGGNFQVATGRFNRNAKSIVVQPFAGLHPGRVTGTTFSSTSNLNAPLQGNRAKTAIEITDVDSILIGDPAADDNLFNNHDFGIQAFNSSVLIRNNLFEGLTGGVLPSGIAIQAIDTDFDPADASTWNSITIGGGPALAANGFTDCFRAADITDYVHMNIVNNTVLNPGQGQLIVGDHGFFIKNRFANTFEIRDNTLFNLGTAIHALRVRDTLFANAINITNNTISTTGSGSVGTGILFEDVITGTSINLIFNAPMNISDNTMFRVNNGIRVSGVTLRYNVENNYIGLANVTAGNGIRLQAASTFLAFARVQANVIQGMSTSFTGLRGIFATMSPDADISCNNIFTVGQSLVFEGFMPARVWNNTLSGYTDGLVLADAAAVIGQQGTAVRPSDNVWLGPLVNSHVLTIAANGANSPFFVRNFSLFNPSLVPGGVKFIPPGSPIPFTSATGTFQVCPLEEPPAPGPQAAMLEEAAGNGLGFDAEAEWISKFSVFNALKADTTLMYGKPVLQTFYDSAAATGIGRIFEIQELMGQGKHNEAIALNNAFEPSGTIEANYKTFHAVCLKTLGGGSCSLQELDELYALANQCPLEGGAVVYHARSLLNWISNCSIEFSDSCRQAARKKGSEQKQAPEINDTDFVLVYPNPADHTVIFSYMVNGMKAGKVDIYDVTGSRIASYPLNGPEGTLSVGLSAFPSGIYFYRMTGDGYPVYSGRFVVK